MLTYSLANDVAFEFETNLKDENLYASVGRRFGYPGVFNFFLVFIYSLSQ